MWPLIPPGGELSVALTRHQVTCGSKPGVGGIFFPALALFCFILGFSSKVSSPCRLGNSKAAAHVAVDLQCWHCKALIG